MILSSIPHVSASFLTHTADAAARSFVLGCIAGLALNVSRVKSVSLRLNVWRAVLCVALIMPFLGLFLPALTFRLPAQAAQRFEQLRFSSHARSAAANKEASESARSAENARNSKELRVSRPFANTVAENRGLTGGSAAISSKETMLDLPPGHKSSFPARVVAWVKSQVAATPWTAIAATTYLMVTLGFLVRFALGLILSVRLERAAQRVEDRRALALLSSRAHSLGIKRLPRLAESELLSVPVTFGVLRPAILLPAGWRDWDEAELDAVISHEVSHVARRDAFIDRLSLLHRALFWFSPLSWYLTGCLAELAEEASDEAALTAGADRTRYAETLLGFFAELEATPGRAWWQGVAMATAGQAEKRVDRILEWKGSVAMQLKKSVVVLLVMGAVPVVYVAAALRPGVYNFSSSEYGSIQEQEPTPPAPAAAPTPVAPPAPVVAANPVTRVVVTTTATPKVSVAVPTPEIAPTPVATPPAPVTRVTVATAVTPKVSVAVATPAIAPVAIVDPVKVRVLAPLQLVTQSSQSNSTVVVVTGERDGNQFVISSGNAYISVSGNSESYGTDHPSEFVEFLQEKISGDFIWFRRDGKSYVIRDAATIKRAKDFFSAVQELDKKQEELGKQQEALGEKQEALGKQQEEVHVQIPDMTEDLHKLEAELKALGKTGTQEDLGRIQGEIGELQSRLGELQSVAGEEQGRLGEKQGALGEEQGKLGEQQGELGRQQEQIFKDASRQMKTLIDDAMAHGLAKPE
jgi:beta-lactamase regulating signal transducer with metallopeptidase domain